MTMDDIRILIAADDGETIVELTDILTSGLNADLTIVDTVEGAGTLAASGAFDIILAAGNLADGAGLSLLNEENAAIATPVVLLDDLIDADRVLAAMRNGAADVFAPPFDRDYLLRNIRRVIRSSRERRRHNARALRLRRLSSRLIRDRRELRQRVDLICRDLVGAYRRLAEKTVTTGEGDIPDRTIGRLGK